MAEAIPHRWLQGGRASAICASYLGKPEPKGTMMKRAGKPAGHDFADNRVPGGGQRVREGLTERPELDNQGSVIKTHRDGFPWSPLPRAQSAGGRQKALTMRRIARGLLPTRRKADTISMGLYH